MASSTCLRLENVIFSSTNRKLRQTNANGSVLLSSPIRSLSLLSPSPLFSPKFALLKNLLSVSSSLSVKASSSTAIAEPEGIKINSVSTKPIEGQKTGTSGLRKKVKIFKEENYLANWIQALFNSLPPEDYKNGVLVLGGDGRYFNLEASQIIIKIAAGNGVGKILVGKEGIMSTPAVSAVIRKRKANGGFIMSASHNPGGPEYDWGIKFNYNSGQPAPESITDKIYGNTLSISEIKMADIPDVDLSTLGVTKYGNFSVEVVDPVSDYLELMENVFDFELIKSLLSQSDFRFIFDAMHAVTGAYAKPIFVDKLGASLDSISNGVPLEDFGHGHPDPNLTYAKDLVDIMYAENGPDFGAASDGDGDRNMVLGRGYGLSLSLRTKPYRSLLVAMTEVATSVVHEVLGPRFLEVDQPIIDYIINVLADEDFDFGDEGEGAFNAIGELLVGAECVSDFSECRQVCSKLSDKFGKHGLVKPKPTVRSLTTPFRMDDGMDEEVKKKKPEPIDGPVLTERDKMKIERRKRKDERQREAQYQIHLAEMEAVRAGMPVACVTHDGGGGGPNVKDIHLENFNISVGGRDLIVDGSVTLSFGRHYGLVGRNGTGKTTFLRYMALHAIDGIPRNCQILHVEQEVVGDDTSALQCVLDSDIERTRLLEEEVRLHAQQRDLDFEDAAGNGKGDQIGAINKDAISQRLEEIYKRLELIDAYSAEARAASILAGLSFSPDMQKKATRTFSGGWRMRIALARALFIEPDVLLLDEPTNHLDLHAVLWLESYLVKWPKTFIVVSHAREFLNTVVTDILHLQGQKLTAYKGDYDTFERTRDEQLKNQRKAIEANEKSRAHMQTFIDKFRYNAKRASLVQSRIKALDRLGHMDEIVNDPDYKFEFPTPDDRPGAPIISFSDASFGYPGGPLMFKNLNFGIDLDSRIAMVGPNGIGKSTILKLIAGELQPTSGTVFRSAKVRIAVFSQHHVDGLDLSSNPLLYMMRCFPGVPEQKLRAHLGSFGVTGNLALQPMYTLSGGQKSRVAFAKITFKKPHIILLDEPSNHLDLDAVEALIQGLVLFQGGILMVSHDEHLISGSVDELWVVSEGKVTPFHGTFLDYKKILRSS